MINITQEFNPYEIPKMIHHECILEEGKMGRKDGKRG